MMTSNDTLPFRHGRTVSIVLVLFFLFLIGYAYFEARAVLFGPQITVPPSRLTTREQHIELRGQALYISELRLNGSIIPVTEDGRFSEPYLLAPGMNQLILDAKDKFGRTKKEVVEVYYEAPRGAPTPLSTPTQGAQE